MPLTLRPSLEAPVPFLGLFPTKETEDLEASFSCNVNTLRVKVVFSPHSMLRTELCPPPRYQILTLQSYTPVWGFWEMRSLGGKEVMSCR